MSMLADFSGKGPLLLLAYLLTFPNYRRERMDGGFYVMSSTYLYKSQVSNIRKKGLLIQDLEYPSCVHWYEW